VWRQYCKSFAAAFPAVTVNEPLTELEGTTAYYVPSRNVGATPLDAAPRKVLVGRKEARGYVCQSIESTWGSMNINPTRLFATESHAWMEINRQLSTLAEQYRAAADAAWESSFDRSNAFAKEGE
jgi:hypothetical protein